MSGVDERGRVLVGSHDVLLATQTAIAPAEYAPDIHVFYESETLFECLGPGAQV